jgi:uncharacterized protein YceH (UPF0502 family)
MNSTEQTPEPSGPTWKELLSEARSLMGRAGANAYRRAKILCRVFNDVDFRAAHGNLDDFQAADLLDDLVQDLCLSFLDLRRVLDRFPRRKDWREGRLSRMFAEATKATTQERPLSGKPRPVSGETRARLEAQLVEARKEHARLRAAATSELDQLRARVADLEAENAALHQRIDELERLLASASA